MQVLCQRARRQLLFKPLQMFDLTQVQHDALRFFVPDDPTQGDLQR
jgi:hypothetical protein